MGANLCKRFSFLAKLNSGSKKFQLKSFVIVRIVF